MHNENAIAPAMALLAARAILERPQRKALCFEAGMSDFIVKPIAPNKIFATLLAWLEKKSVLQ